MATNTAMEVRSLQSSPSFWVLAQFRRNCSAPAHQSPTLPGGRELAILLLGAFNDGPDQRGSQSPGGAGAAHGGAGIRAIVTCASIVYRSLLSSCFISSVLGKCCLKGPPIGDKVHFRVAYCTGRAEAAVSLLALAIR
jgi:hypothetical protein